MRPQPDLRARWNRWWRGRPLPFAIEGCGDLPPTVPRVSCAFVEGVWTESKLRLRRSEPVATCSPLRRRGTHPHSQLGEGCGRRSQVDVRLPEESRTRRVLVICLSRQRKSWQIVRRQTRDNISRSVSELALRRVGYARLVEGAVTVSSVPPPRGSEGSEGSGVGIPAQKDYRRPCA